MPGEGRHFATVLFLDIVGSTQIADELGDARWRSLLGRFRHVVRVELKRHGGHEVDTAGDGFLVTFPEPMSALRAGAQIIPAVQAVGLDVRVGVHAGEVEFLGKGVSGVTVHIGARVMAAAGAAQLFVTSAVRDMERGGDVSFEDAGMHTLKGIDGTWHLYAVAAVSGSELPDRIEPALAAERRDVERRSRPRRRTAVAASLLLVPALVAAGLLLSRPRAERASPAVPMRPVMLEIDPTSQRITAELDAPMSLGWFFPAPADLGGQLVRVLNDRVEFRTLSGGALVDSLPIDPWDDAAIGAGAIWLATRAPHEPGGVRPTRWARIDPRTGEPSAPTIVRAGIFSTIWFGPGGGWFEDADVNVVRLDTVTLHTHTYLMRDMIPWMPVPYPHGVWLPDPLNETLAWMDGRTDRVHDVAVPRGAVYIIEGRSFYEPRRLLLLDTETGVITPLGDGRPEPAEAFAIAGRVPTELANPAFRFLFATSLNETLWVAAYAEPSAGRRSDSALIGISEGGGLPVSIPLPDGFEAKYTPIADRSTGRIWVSECYGCFGY